MDSWIDLFMGFSDDMSRELQPAFSSRRGGVRFGAVVSRSNRSAMCRRSQAGQKSERDVSDPVSGFLSKNRRASEHGSVGPAKGNKEDMYNGISSQKSPLYLILLKNLKLILHLFLRPKFSLHSNHHRGEPNPHLLQP